MSKNQTYNSLVKKWIIDNVLLKRDPDTVDFEYDKSLVSTSLIGKLKVLEITAQEGT